MKTNKNTATPLAFIGLVCPEPPIHGVTGNALLPCPTDEEINIRKKLHELNPMFTEDVFCMLDKLFYFKFKQYIEMCFNEAHSSSLDSYINKILQKEL